MRRYYLALLIVWIHCGDIFTAWLFDGGAFSGATMLRPYRDTSIVITACVCLLTTRIPKDLLVAILLYGLLVLMHLPLGISHGVSSQVLVGSFGTLMIPPLLFLVGYYCIRTPWELRRSAALMITLGLASALFGIWDVAHTDFWVNILKFPEYSAEIKGVLAKSTHPETGLPWNFYMGTMEHLQRRAAGLLAAPLAQGSFLSIAALLALALWQKRTLGSASPWISATLCAFLLSGVWLSGTRGAMLIACIALLGYVASSHALSRIALVRVLIAGAVLAGIVMASLSIIINTIYFLDGSSSGHWAALIRNLQDLPQVLLIGGGLGRQGPAASTLFLSSLGGGEGSIFSIAFQIGLPGALVFVFFYLQLMRKTLAGYRHHQETLGLAIFWLACGFTVTFVTSEHILSVSGSAALWLMLGGAIRALAPIIEVSPRPSITPSTVDIATQ